MANLNRIKLVPVEKNKTCKWLADELGKRHYSVHKWCRHRIQPDLQTLNKIARVLHVNLRICLMIQAMLINHYNYAKN